MEFDVDVIKLDRRFFFHERDSKSEKVISSIIGLAKEIGADVVAEGIEAESQLDFLCSAAALSQCHTKYAGDAASACKEASYMVPVSALCAMWFTAFPLSPAFLPPWLRYPLFLSGLPARVFPPPYNKSPRKAESTAQAVLFLVVSYK